MFWQRLIWGLVLSLPGLACGQLQQAQGLTLQFQRQNNFTYSTRLQWYYEHRGDRYELAWNTVHNNLLNSTRRDRPFVQMQFHHDLWQFYRLKGDWSVASWLEADQFFSSGNQRYSLYLGGRWQPDENLEVQTYLGYSWDYRDQRLDEGWSPSLRLLWRRSWEDGPQQETQLFARYKNLFPREQVNLSLDSRWTQRFSPGAQMAFQLIGGRNQMDNYRSESVEQIVSDTAAAILSWTYRLTDGLVWESNNRVVYNRRALDYQSLAGAAPEFNDLHFDQIDLSTRQRLSLNAGRLRGYMLYEFQNLNRQYELANDRLLPDFEYLRLRDRERQKDYFRDLTNLEFLLEYQLDARHQLSLSGNNRYLQYDTPAEDNFDDHDELNYGLNLGWQTDWTEKFQTSYRLLGSVRRYAFLLRERSQDNYTQRNLRMEFGYLWRPTDAWRIEGQQYLYVTYNVKDFEDRNLTDRATRNLETRLKFAYRINREMEWNGELYRREIHVSYLNWEAFTETTLDTTTTYLIQSDWKYRPRPRSGQQHIWEYQAGYKHVAQLRYQNTSMTNLANILTPINLRQRNHQTGPVTGLRWQHRSGAMIFLSVWWQLQSLTFKYKAVERLSTLNSSFREEDLITPLLTFRPFIQLRAQVRLGL